MSPQRPFLARGLVALGLSGSYRTDRPAGAAGPSDASGAAAAPKVTARMAGRAVPTNEWWSSLVWQRHPANPYSENLYAHPLSFRAAADGLGVGYPTTPTVSADGRMYEYPHRDDLTVGVTGLAAPRTEVDGWSDWTVSPRWSDGVRTFRATIGHGLPFLYGEASGGPAMVRFDAPATIWHHGGSVLGVTVNGHDYALFAPSRVAWSLTGTSAATAPAPYFSVAVLPDRAALGLFAKYAYAFVTDTRVHWCYDAATARVTATYTATTTTREGTSPGTLLALYRHQWLNSADPVTRYRYVDGGRLRVPAGSTAWHGPAGSGSGSVQGR